MDLTIAAGSTLTLVAGGERLTLKTLAAATVSGPGTVEDGSGVTRVPVIGPSEALRLGPGRVEVATAAGLVSLLARVVDDGSGMSLALGSAGPLTQRRGEVRGDVELALQVTLPAPDGGPSLRVVSGRTRNISAGGLLASLDVGTGGAVRPGTVVPMVLTMPDGPAIQVNLTVIEVTHFGLRGAFVALEHREAERIARLVFAKERERLAARRRQADRGPEPVPGRTRSW